MSAYDKYYQTENLFGEAYPELIAFFKKRTKKGTVLDLGCGQGRDAIPLARLGFEVLGVDNSAKGIAQMNAIATAENLPLSGEVADIYEFEDYGAFDFLLLDSMFHFTKSSKKKEIALVKKIIESAKPDAIIVFCIQDTGNKVKILNETIDEQGGMERLYETNLMYRFVDQESQHSSETAYKMLVIKK